MWTEIALELRYFLANGIFPFILEINRQQKIEQE